MELSKPDQVRSARTERRFFIDNTIIDDYGDELGPYGIAIYATLCRFANKDKQDCFPSHGTLAGRCGMSERQVIRKLKDLEKLGLIRWERRFKEGGGQTSNLYVLLDPPIIEGGVTVSQTNNPHLNNPLMNLLRKRRTKHLLARPIRLYLLTPHS